MSAAKRIRVIANPASGRHDQPFLYTMNRVFRRFNIRWKFDVTHKYGDGCRLAQKAVKKGDKYDMVLVYGGDGTVRDVANGLVGTDVPLAVLAGGTGNAVAAELKVPNNLERALEQICLDLGEIRPIDVGKIGDSYFLLRADTGLSAKLMQETPREMKDRLGVLAYLLTFARTLAEPPQRNEYSVVIDGKTYESTGAACIVANMGSVGTLGLSMGRGVKHDDGLLDVFILKRNVFTVLSAAASAVDLTNFEEVFQSWKGREIRIETPSPQALNCDAEPCTKTPVTIQMMPQALQMFVPQL